MLSAKFRVAGTFEVAMGKFPIGTTGGFAYMQINSALQHFIKSTTVISNVIPNLSE